PRILIDRSKLVPSRLPRVSDRPRLFLALARKFVGDFCVQLGKLDVELRLDAPGFGLALGSRDRCEPRQFVAEPLHQAISRHQIFITVHRRSKTSNSKDQNYRLSCDYRTTRRLRCRAL